MHRPFFLCSEEGDALFLAMRLQQEGVPVALYIKAAHAQDVGRGLVPRAESPNPPRDAVVVFDSTGFSTLGTFFRSRGHPVIGGSEWDRLEINRPAGVKFMEAHGVKAPETHPFTDAEAAIGFLRANPGQWFVKLSGHPFEASTYDAPDSVSMIRYLEWAGRQPHGLGPGFEIQRRQEGTEVSIEGWFDGTRFVRPFNCTIEEKFQLAGDKGSRTGCESNVVWALDGDDPPLAEKTLLLVESALAERGEAGPLDLNTIIAEDGTPHGIEWTAFRLGFDASQAFLALINPEFGLGEQLEAFAEGDLVEWYLRPGLSLTLRLSRPPYPIPNAAAARATKGLPLDPQLLEDEAFTVTDVMKGRDGKPAMAGRDGLIGTVGAVGTDIESLRSEVLGKAGTLVIPALQYRIDPVSRAERDWRRLHEHKYLSHAGMEWRMDGGVGPPPTPATPVHPIDAGQKGEEALVAYSAAREEPVRVIITDPPGPRPREG